jgi:hypothetical protein
LCFNLLFGLRILSTRRFKRRRLPDRPDFGGRSAAKSFTRDI